MYNLFWHLFRYKLRPSLHDLPLHGQRRHRYEFGPTVVGSRFRSPAGFEDSKTTIRAETQGHGLGGSGKTNEETDKGTCQHKRATFLTATPPRLRVRQFVCFKNVAGVTNRKTNILRNEVLSRPTPHKSASGPELLIQIVRLIERSPSRPTVAPN